MDCILAIQNNKIKKGSRLKKYHRYPENYMIKMQRFMTNFKFWKRDNHIKTYKCHKNCSLSSINLARYFATPLNNLQLLNCQKSMYVFFCRNLLMSGFDTYALWNDSSFSNMRHKKVFRKIALFYNKLNDRFVWSGDE